MLNEGKEAVQEDHLEIYTTPGGTHAITSPVKVRILTLLGRGDLNFDEVVEAVDRAKSTVSVHLQDLIAGDLVKACADPGDARKKSYTLAGKYLGTVSSSSRIRPELVEYPPTTLEWSHDTTGFFRMLFLTIRTSLLEAGVGIEPIFFAAGYRFGEALFPTLPGWSHGTFISDIAVVWARHGLGTVTRVSESPLVIEVTDCFECRDLPRVGRPSCAFESGVFTALFSLFAGSACKVIETHCYAMGDGHCRFEITTDDA
jgi:hypothetical protein